MALGICLVAEIVGVWFLNSEMNIPLDRMNAANWVLQCSIFTFMVSLISVPYNSSIIAHEHMKAFAYIGIIEILFKLLAVLSLRYWKGDILIVYALLLLGITIIIRLINGWYCKRKFEECRYQFIFDRGLFRQMFSFAGWNFVGASSGVMRDQGINVLLNLFCGPLVNTARGIAMQVCVAIQGFVGSFMTALNPQITKSYATENRDYLMKLVFQGARFSFYLLLLLSLPILFETEIVLKLWLKIVPDYTIAFVRLIVVYIMSESLSYTLITLMLATGNIRNYQLIVGGCQMLNFPLSYLFLKLGYAPEYTIVISIFIAMLCFVLRLYMLRGMVGLPVGHFIRKVFLNVLFVSLISCIVPLLISNILLPGVSRLLLTCIFSTICTIIVIFYVGCSLQERLLLKVQIGNFLTKFNYR